MCSCLFIDASGHPFFQALQHRAAHPDTIVFYAFDLLHLDGENLTGRPLKERRLLLPKVVKDSGVHILAPQGGELAAQAALIVGHRMKLQDVVESIPMFPTLSEAITLVAPSFTRDVSKMSCCV
jgi:hypothetical protein